MIIFASLVVMDIHDIRMYEFTYGEETFSEAGRGALKGILKLLYLCNHAMFDSKFLWVVAVHDYLCL